MGDPRRDADRRSNIAEPTTVAGLSADRFDLLIEARYPAVLGYLARRLGRELADDLAAETFAIAYRDRARFDPLRGSEAAWLFAIATGLLAHHRRTERRRLAAFAKSAPPKRDEDSTASAAVDHVAASDALAMTARALVRIPARERDALYLVAVAGLDYDDAAAALSVPVGTVRSRVARARSRLRIELTGVASTRRAPVPNGGSNVD